MTTQDLTLFVLLLVATAVAACAVLELRDANVARRVAEADAARQKATERYHRACADGYRLRALLAESALRLHGVPVPDPLTAQMEQTW